MELPARSAMRSSSALARVLSAIVAVGPMITCALDNGLGLTPPMGWNSCELDRELDAIITHTCRHTLHACICTRGALTPPLALACCQPATRTVLMHAFWCSMRAGQPMATACSWLVSKCSMLSLMLINTMYMQFAWQHPDAPIVLSLRCMACKRPAEQKPPSTYHQGCVVPTHAVDTTQCSKLNVGAAQVAPR